MGKASALALVREASPPAAFDAWLSQGRALLEQRTQTEWALADWIAIGKEQFGNQVEFDFLADQLGIAPKSLRQAASVARAFPAPLRANNLPYEVHAYLASLPEDRRIDTLRKASTERWGEQQAKAAVVEHRQQVAMFEDEDDEHRHAVEIIRSWNRAPIESRRYAYELMDADTFAAIDEDQPHA